MLHNWENQGRVLRTKHDMDADLVSWKCKNCQSTIIASSKSKPTRRRVRLYGVSFPTADGLYSCNEMVVGGVQED